MKCKLKSSVNMKLKDGQTAKLTEVQYVPQVVKNLLSVSSLVLKGSTIGKTKEKIVINKNGLGTTLDTRKGQNNSIVFYLKEKRYSPEGQEALTNLPENKMKTSEEKEEWRKKLGLSSEIDIKVVHRYSHLGEKLLRVQHNCKFAMVVQIPRQKNVW